MDVIGFKIHKPRSITIKVNVSINSETISVDYVNYDCLVYRNKMNNFVVNRMEIECCKKKYKWLINLVDVLFYLIIILGLFAGLYWENKMNLSLFSKEVFAGIFVILVFFTFLKFTQVLELRIKNGKVYYIPVTGFVFCFSKEINNKVNKLYSLLS